jgi:hypothetical protein
MEEHPSVTLVTSGSATFGSRSVIRQPALIGQQPGSKVIYECLHNGRGNWIGEPTVVMFRKSSVDHHKFNPNYICLVDLDMWLRLLTEGDCYIVPETLAYFRVHAKQASDKNRIRNWFDEYYFYRDVKEQNNYKVSMDNLNIDETVKRKAKKCLKRTFDIMPAFYKKGNLSLIFEGLKIGRSEKLIW